jgi:hypothetical protein
LIAELTAKEFALPEYLLSSYRVREQQAVTGTELQ